MDAAQSEKDMIQEVWDTYYTGGPYAHNLIGFRLRSLEKQYGKGVAMRVYEELLSKGL